MISKLAITLAVELALALVAWGLVDYNDEWAGMFLAVNVLALFVACTSGGYWVVAS